VNILLIDNRDSFTFNLAEAFRLAGARPYVVRNSIDARSAFDRALNMEATILLSPGPGRPADAGCCLELVRLARGRVPVIGICLGHQAIGEEAGCSVVRAPEPCHGKCSALEHNGTGPFAGLPTPLFVGRYHSLCVLVDGLPKRFIVDAKLAGMAMAIRDDVEAQLGLQFHPESILTPKGDRLIGAMLDWARRRRQAIARLGAVTVGSAAA
jgi:anthranilate synthase/aminodeoxychorismate synthase-like glutamine amidotransferase